MEQADTAVEPDVAMDDDNLGSQQILNQCFIALADQAGTVTLPNFLKFLSKVGATTYLSQQEIESAICAGAGVLVGVGEGRSGSLSLAMFRAAMMQLAHVRFQLAKEEAGVDKDDGGAEKIEAGDGVQFNMGPETQLELWVKHELRPSILASGLVSNLDDHSREVPKVTSNTKRPKSACKKTGTPESRTAELAAHAPEDKLLARVLMTYLPKREPLMRIQQHYQALDSKQQSRQASKTAISTAKVSNKIPSGARNSLSLNTWKTFLADFGLLPALLTRRAAEIIHERSFQHLSEKQHPPYAQFALALAHTCLFVFAADSVQISANDMLAHMQASDGGNIVRSGEVFRGARMKPLLLVTEDELRCRVAKESETQTNTVTDVDAKNAERQRPTQARPASSQDTREETKDIWERVYEKGQEHVSILRRRNTASKAAAVAAEEAETRVRPQLTMAARHLIRSTKDLSKWDENRQKRIAAQKERWEEKELEAMRDPLLCPQSRALCQKQSGTSRDADVVERLLGYGEEYKALKQLRQLETSLEAKEMAEMYKKKINPMSEQLVLRREMEEVMFESSEEDMGREKGAGGARTDRMYQRHFYKEQKLKELRQRVAAQDTTDPETGKRFFQPETIKRSEHLRLALCLIDSYENEHTAP